MKQWVFVLLLLMLLMEARADTGDEKWSSPVKGMRARLYTEVFGHSKSDSAFTVWVEFEEVGQPSSQGVTHEERRFSFFKSDLNFYVEDQTGHMIQPNIEMGGNELSAASKVVLRSGTRQSFLIGTGGKEQFGVSPLWLLNLGLTARWIIAQGAERRLLATFTIGSPSLGNLKPEASHPWMGTLLLPPIDLPTF